MKKNSVDTGQIGCENWREYWAGKKKKFRQRGTLEKDPKAVNQETSRKSMEIKKKNRMSCKKRGGSQAFTGWVKRKPWGAK